MKKTLFLIVFTSIGFLGSGQDNYTNNQYETVANIIKQIDIGTYNGVKNNALDASIIAINLFKIIKVLKSSNGGYFGFPQPAAPDPFILSFDLSAGLELNLRK